MRYLQTKRLAGFTLVETLVVITLFTLLTLVVFNIIISFYRYNSYTVAQTSELQNARQGVDLMVRDIREMTFADNGQFPLVTMGSTSIEFFSDIDRDDSVEFVRYELSTTTLRKYVYDAVAAVYSTTTPSATITVSEFVQNELEALPVFRYYDLDGLEATGASSAADIRYISMNVIVNVDPVRNPGEFVLRSSAALRNIIETY